MDGAPDATPTSFGPGRVVSLLQTGTSIFAFAILVTTFRTDAFDGVIRWVIGIVVPLGLLIVAGAIGTPLSRRRRVVQQARRDQRASALLAEAQDGKPSIDYSLYLRAFASSGNLDGEAPADFMQAGFDPRSIEDRNLDLETLFAMVLEPEAPLVALGKPEEHEGAGRVETNDATWTESFRALARHALLIIIVPTPGRSLEWEVSWLQEHNVLSKCLFVMPPGKPSLSQRFDWKPEWDSIRSALKAKGLELPEHDHEGAMFVLGPNGQVVERESLLGPDPKPLYISSNLGRLLQRMAR
ncbi:MAG: hypothetical protein AAGA48_00835 [Myxococcota bacterium]